MRRLLSLVFIRFCYRLFVVWCRLFVVVVWYCLLVVDCCLLSVMLVFLGCSSLVIAVCLFSQLFCVVVSCLLVCLVFVGCCCLMHFVVGVVGVVVRVLLFVVYRCLLCVVVR